MLASLSRLFFSPHNTGFRFTARLVYTPTPISRGRYAHDQLEYLRSMLSSSTHFEWATIKKNTLELQGSVNAKNIDAIFLKVMLSSKNFDAALSYSEYLKETSSEISLGAINGLLNVYYEMGKETELSAEIKAFILESYKNLYSKYKVLDSVTCERLLHALCAINDWKKALKVLDDIELSNTPSHSAFSVLIATFFNLNKKAEAVKLIQRSVISNRALNFDAYSAWIKYILRKFKDKKIVTKHLEDICRHIVINSVSVNEQTAKLIQETFSNLNWDAQFTKIRKKDGQCMCCNQAMECLKLTDEEFLSLQKNIKEKVIVGSDLFLKTSPEELERFLKFVQQTSPYDIVLDALNIAFVGRKSYKDRVGVLNDVVTYFKNQNKKILLLGRKHMLHWPRKQMQQIMSKSSCFFTDDLSQDDPFFITAAILSGSHTDFVSKDLLRSHRFVLRDEKLQLSFRRWQWQHQHMVFITKTGKLIIQPPLVFTPCAQTKNGAWHLPVEKEVVNSAQVNDGTPDLTSWLCLRPKSPDK